MTPDELKQQHIEQLKLPQDSQPVQRQQDSPNAGNPLDEFIAVLSSIRRPHKHVTAAPTVTPKTFIDQFQLYDDGTNRRLYVYLNGVWRYTTLT